MLIAIVVVLVFVMGGCVVVVGSFVHCGAKVLVGWNDCFFLLVGDVAVVILGKLSMVELMGLVLLVGVVFDNWVFFRVSSCMFMLVDG